MMEHQTEDIREVSRQRIRRGVILYSLLLVVIVLILALTVYQYIKTRHRLEQSQREATLSVMQQTKRLHSRHREAVISAVLRASRHRKTIRACLGDRQIGLREILIAGDKMVLDGFAVFNRRGRLLRGDPPGRSLHKRQKTTYYGVYQDKLYLISRANVEYGGKRIGRILGWQQLDDGYCLDISALLRTTVLFAHNHTILAAPVASRWHGLSLPSGPSELVYRARRVYHDRPYSLLRRRLSREPNVTVDVLHRRDEVTRFQKQTVRHAAVLLLLAAAAAAVAATAAVFIWRSDQDIRRQQAMVIQADKLAALGEMASGMAHEINQPLTAIQLASDHLGLSETPLSDDFLSRKLSAINDGVHRIGYVIDHVRRFSRPHSVDTPAAFSLLDAVADAHGLIAEQLRKRGIQYTAPTPRAVRVMGYRYQFEQVLLNLLANARDALDQAGLTRPAIDINCDTAGDQAVLDVANNGPGVPRSIRDKIFMPFFTTKPAQTGTGLGLSISRSLMGRMGGTLTLHKSDRSGTVFRLTLPLAPEVPHAN